MKCTTEREKNLSPNLEGAGCDGKNEDVDAGAQKVDPCAGDKSEVFGLLLRQRGASR